jgi:hypothetical protein
MKLEQKRVSLVRLEDLTGSGGDVTAFVHFHNHLGLGKCPLESSRNAPDRPSLEFRRILKTGTK